MSPTLDEMRWAEAYACRAQARVCRRRIRAAKRRLAELEPSNRYERRQLAKADKAFIASLRLSIDMHQRVRHSALLSARNLRR